jgi:hypothetical protein
LVFGLWKTSPAWLIQPHPPDFSTLIVWPPEGVSIPRTPLFATVSEINVRDAHTIEFKLHEPRPSSFMLAAFANGWNVIVRKQTLEDNNYNLRRRIA